MWTTSSPVHAPAVQRSTWWSRTGLAGLLFFLAKGLLWLLAPALLALIDRSM